MGDAAPAAKGRKGAAQNLSGPVAGAPAQRALALAQAPDKSKVAQAAEKDELLRFDTRNAPKEAEAQAFVADDKREENPAPSARAAAKAAPQSGALALQPSVSQEGQAQADQALTKRFNDDFNTEGYDRIVENSFAKALEDPLSTFSIDVDTASYANVRRFIEGGSLPPPDAVRIEELVNYFSYDYADPKGDAPFGFDTELARLPLESPSTSSCASASRPSASPRRTSRPLTWSSSSTSRARWTRRTSFPSSRNRSSSWSRRCARRTRSPSSSTRATRASSSPPRPGSRKETILAAIDDLEAGGSTAGGEGIQLAYETAKKAFIPKGNNRVILATDGDFNVGASSDGELVRIIEEKRKEGVFLTVLGFGMGNYQDSKMQKLADSGNGNYAYIDYPRRGRQGPLEADGRHPLSPSPRTSRSRSSSTPRVVGEYRLIGYEKRALAARDFADDTKDAGELGAGSSVTALYELVPAERRSARRTDLKYQSAAVSPKAASSGELMTIKFRYKKPDGDVEQASSRSPSPSPSASSRSPPTTSASPRPWPSGASSSGTPPTEAPLPIPRSRISPQAAEAATSRAIAPPS